MVHFSGKARKTNHVSSLLRERSARKTSVFNQKTMFLGYAHSSYIFLCASEASAWLNNYVIFYKFSKSFSNELF
ncbi:MAG: hypothetical protein U5L45_10200 [Saprospiraceae bacterium]|nr:hypothetical protein [Saprospiraceae bacterium]